MAPALPRGEPGAKRPLACLSSEAPRPRRLETHRSSWPQRGHGAQGWRARTAATPESSRRLETAALSEPGASRDSPPLPAPRPPGDCHSATPSSSKERRVAALHTHAQPNPAGEGTPQSAYL